MFPLTIFLIILHRKSRRFLLGKFKEDFGGLSFQISVFFYRNIEVPDKQLVQIFVFFKDSIVFIVNKKNFYVEATLVVESPESFNYLP